MNREKIIPGYVLASVAFIGLFAFVFALNLLQDVLVPLCISLIISITLQPLVSFCEAKGLNRVVAISLPLLVILILALVSLFGISTQVNLFMDAMPVFISKWDSSVLVLSEWWANNFGLTALETSTWMEKEKANLLISVRSFIKPIFLTFGEFLVLLLLVPVYVFMILYYKPLLQEFMISMADRPFMKQFKSIVDTTRSIVKNYLVGLMIESAIVGALNVCGLLLLGVDYALLLGFIGGALNVVPYIGGIIAVLLPMLVVLATKPMIYLLYVMLLYVFVQMLDNNFIMPRVVGSHVQINGLVSVVVVILGAAVWGVSGMFFSIPFIAIVKVFLDHLPGYEPWGKLLGNERNLLRSKK